MSEEIKTTRLNKVAKEFNVGVSTLVEHLAKKGHQVDSNPNTRITAEQYAILSQAFQGEREVKENADRIEIISGDTRSVNAAKTEEKETKKEADEELVIKNYHPAKPADAETPSVSDTPAPKAEEEPVPEPEVPQAEEPQVEEPKAEEPKAEEPVEETPKFEPTVISATVAGAKEGKESFNAELRIVDKIDLSSLNEKTRPAKKSKSEKKAKKAETKPAAEEKPVEEKAPVVEETPAPVVEEAVVEETPVVEAAPEPVAETPAPEPEKKVEFVPTQYTKLEGLKTVGKIDLSQFAKEKVSPAEKRKRKRIKGEKVDQKAAAENVARGDKKENKPAKPNGGNGDAQKPNPNNDPNRNKDKAKEKKNKDKKAKGKEVKVEVDEAEIKKQIQDTLARLSPMGKSKTSKHNREKRQKVQQRFEEEMLHEMENQKTLQVTEFVTANELATMMNIPVTKIIATCMSVGIFVSINQRLDAEAIKLIADEFGFEINFVSTEVAEAINSIEEQDNPEDLVPRTPIITVMGHVDHGKTSLLDYIRNTNVIAGEAGGITQHIGAYEVTMPDGRKITFLDTPGHEAFTAMRARGAKVTDIAIIVIAADDKIMPQTIEAINHAQAAAVPMVFAINKIDKPGADPDRIKTELANMNLLVEEWGGKYQSQDISAKKGINVDQLLEKVLLEAEMLELKGNPKKRAKGTVLECSLDKGRGYVAKLLVEDGTISQGDPLVAGPISGRVKAMYNERNQLVKSAGPSQPVLLLGLTGACQAGDTFNVTENEKEAKDIAAKRQQLAREQSQRTTGRLTLDEIGRRRALGDFHEIKLIVKGDVDGSVEALSDSLIKLSTEEIQINVIHKAVGQITEGDVLLAEASDAIIIGFQVRPSVQARRNAEEKKIDIRLYSIIYDAINELHDAMEGMLAPETQEKIVANLEIRETFKISKVGTIAGCMCLDGKIQRSHNVRIIRDGIVVFTGKLASLKRFKDDVKEVVSGQDCGLNIENFNDIKVGDIVEAYEIIEIKRTLK